MCTVKRILCLLRDVFLRAAPSLGASALPAPFIPTPAAAPAPAAAGPAPAAAPAAAPAPAPAAATAAAAPARFPVRAHGGR
jgi:hypothetical protein